MDQPTDTRPTTAEGGGDVFVVVRGDNHAGLAAGTRLVEVRRFEIWEHPGCISSIRNVMAALRVLDGPRSGEVIETFLECGYEYDPPWPAPRQDWLEPGGSDRTAPPIVSPGQE